MAFSIELIAQVAHEINRAYCQAIGDDSQPCWDDAPAWQQNSAVDGVLAHMREPLTPEESHEKRTEYKLKEGWKYGPVKDPVKKEHPCMVPYEQLSQEQRVKDYLFKAVVNTLADL
jgi:hypothetical protein